MMSPLWEEIGEDNFTGNLDDALDRARRYLKLPPDVTPRRFPPTVSREKI